MLYYNLRLEINIYKKSVELHFRLQYLKCYLLFGPTCRSSSKLTSPYFRVEGRSKQVTFKVLKQLSHFLKINFHLQYHNNFNDMHSFRYCTVLGTK